MRMVGVEHFRAAVHQAEFCRIAQIAARNGRRRIAERIGAVGHGFILESEIFVLRLHVVDAERLAAVIQRAGHRPIDVGQRIALRNEVAFLVHRTERFIPHFMIENTNSRKSRPGAVLDDGLPSAVHRRRLAGSQRIEIFRPLAAR